MGSTAAPTVIRYCRICKQDTRHDLIKGMEISVWICVLCLGRALRYEQTESAADFEAQAEAPQSLLTTHVYLP
jgi:hypothetical protein